MKGAGATGGTVDASGLCGAEPTSVTKELALLVCGALRREVSCVARERGWDVDIHPIPALHHLEPDRIVSSVQHRLERFRNEYQRVVVVYGDCGTAGRLDEVLAGFPAVRLKGPHCYEMFAGPEFERISEEHPGTFFLTDWLVKAFDRVVIQALGLDRYPELKDAYFGNYTGVVYLQQVPDKQREEKARDIAGYLGVPLQIRHVGLGQLRDRLIRAVEGARPQGAER
jgi:hypothetical protein